MPRAARGVVRVVEPIPRGRRTRTTHGARNAIVHRRSCIDGWCIGVAAALLLAACAQQPVTPPPPPVPESTPPQVELPAAQPSSPARKSAPPGEVGWTQRGRVSLYGASFAGKTTASGERFDPNAMTMAHRTLPFGTLVRVTNVENQRSVEVRVNDRGPFVAGRIADLSLAAARQIGMVADGVIDAVLEVPRAPVD